MKSTYSTTDVNLEDGKLRVGATDAQNVDPTKTVIALQNQINKLTLLEDNYGLSIATQRSPVQIGYNNPDGKNNDPSKYADLESANMTGQSALAQYQFGSTNAIANDKLSGKVFSNIDDIAKWMDAFNTAQHATDNIVSGATNLAGEFGKTTGSLITNIAAINEQFDNSATVIKTLQDSEYLSADQSNNLTIAETKLTDVRQKALQGANDNWKAQVDATNAGFIARYNAADAQMHNDPKLAYQNSLDNFDLAATQQRTEFKNNMVAALGDAYLSTQNWMDESALLERTLGEERLGIQTSYTKQMVKNQLALDNIDSSLYGRYLTATAANDNSPTEALNAQLYNFDISAIQQRQQLTDQLTGMFGDAYVLTSDYADRSAQLEKVLGAERLGIQNAANAQLIAKQEQDAAQIAAKQEQATSSVISTIKSISSYVTGLSTGGDSPLSALDQLTSTRSKFDKDSAASKAGDYNATQNLTGDASSLLNASKQYYGVAGSGYVGDFNKVLDSLSAVVTAGPDTLTASAFASETQTQTATLVQSLASLGAELAAIKLQLRQNATTPKQVAA